MMIAMVLRVFGTVVENHRALLPVDGWEHISREALKCVLAGMIWRLP
jgi:hypothetical protein